MVPGRVGCKDLVVLLVDHLTLNVGNVVVYEQVLSDIEVARFDLVLCAFNAAVDDAGFSRFALGARHDNVATFDRVFVWGVSDADR